MAASSDDVDADVGDEGVDATRAIEGGEYVARVEMDLADDLTLVRLARLTVSGVASVAGLGLDDSERCRSAIDEMCNALLEVAVRGSRLHLLAVTDGRTLEVSGSMPCDPTREFDPTRERLGRLILDAIVDDWTLEAESGLSRFWFCVEAGSAGREAEP